MWKINTYAGMILVCGLILATSQITGQLREKYVGCFTDIENIQKLESILRNQSNLTIEICIQKCYNESNQRKSEMTFAALNNGRRCMCRKNPGQQLGDRNCNVKCTGDPLQVCGGNAANKFYSLYTVCPVGYFGPNCDQLCHCKRHLPCDRKNGICPDGCDEHWTGTTCNISNTQKQYIGCYGDGQQRAMDVKNPGGKTGENKKLANSNEFCIEICSTNNYTYAGMQYGYDCSCGEKYNRYGNRTYNGIQVNCNHGCPANGSQICGGNFANSVYHVCPVGFYGRNCVNICHCFDGGPCRFNGACLTSALSLCRPGWTGFACNIRDCGINNGDCEPDEMCETVDLGFANSSVCRCKDGSYRDNNTCRPTSLHYVGCYKGSTTQYVDVKLLTSDTLTIEICIQKCRQLNKTYSIIQGGLTCLCGDDYGYGQISPDHECQVPCAGNKLQYCGGRNTVNGTPIYVVYNTAKSFSRHYIGCYKDTNIRAMKKEFFWQNARNNTIESCIKHCGSNNYTYAGLQYGSTCFCGDAYDKHGTLPESGCNMTCSGNNSQICGGPYANSVYAVNDILRCSSDKNCKSNETCNLIDLNYMNVSRCRCKQGFHRMSTWHICTDVDECHAGNSTCNPSSENCLNSISSYRCECKDGFVNISGTCEDINECGNESLLCDVETELCNNTFGSYTCNCKPGYENTTFGNCTDVDECQSDNSTCNPSSENCVNLIGSYRCECKDGFVHVNMSGQCEDVDDCRNGSLVCDAETELCKNTIGSYTCHCMPGYENTTFGNCTDVDECQLDCPSSPCNVNSERCINSIGSYMCNCKEGFTDFFGKCVEFNITATIGIILGTLLAISLLINVILIVSRIHSAKSRKPEPGEDMAQPDLESSSIKILDDREMNYDEIQNRASQISMYEQIITGQRQIVVNSASEYAELRQIGYVNVASSN